MKIERLSILLPKPIKRELAKAARQERRSMSSMANIFLVAGFNTLQANRKQRAEG